MNGARLTLLMATAAIALATVAVGVNYVGADALQPQPGSQQLMTAVLGNNAHPVAPAASAVPAFPPPPAPRGAEVEVVPHRPNEALAIWTQGGHVYAGRYARATGWTDVHPLEDILGEPSDLELAASSQGPAMAVWRHTLGEIHSLRYSRFDPATGWGPADVIPGVLPRRLNSGARPKLLMESDGSVTLQWPSSFGGTSAQVTRFEGGHWTVPQDVAAR